MPKELTITPIWQYVRRYQAVSAVSAALTITDLNNSAIMAVSTILGYPVNRCTRIRRIRIWAPIDVQGTNATVTITPVTVDSANNCFVDLPKTISDTTISVSRPAYVEYRPNIDHPSGGWHNTNTVNTNLVLLSAPADSIMDIHYEGVLAFANDPQGYSTVLSGSTAGKMYCRAAASNYVPVGINTI